MSIKAKLEAIIYAAEEPVTLEQMAALLKEDLLAEASVDPAVEAAPADVPAEAAPAEPPAKKKGKTDKSEYAEIKARLKPILEELIADYDKADRGMEIRQVAGGYRMTTKPEHHDVVRSFAKSLKPPVRLSLPALETLAVIAYKQPITAPEISEIRGVDSQGVLGTLIERKLITTAGRKQVVGRPILYKTTKDFLLRFGLNEISELPSMEEFEKMALGGTQSDLFTQGGVPDATGVPDAATPADATPAAEPASERDAAEARAATSPQTES